MDIIATPNTHHPPPTQRSYQGKMKIEKAHQIIATNEVPISQSNPTLPTNISWTTMTKASPTDNNAHRQ